MFLIIDLDVLCYASIKKRPGPATSVAITSVEDVPDNPYSTDGYTAEEDADWLKECWFNLLDKIEFLKEETFATEVVGYVKGDTNFRDALFVKEAEGVCHLLLHDRQFAILERGGCGTGDVAMQDARSVIEPNPRRPKYLLCGHVDNGRTHCGDVPSNEQVDRSGQP